MFAAQKLGYFKDLCLSTNFVTNSQDSTALVSAGKAQVTNVGSAADYLTAVASGSNIKAVATYGNTSDYCVITQKNITSLPQLAGKTLGYHFVKEAPVLAMLLSGHVNLNKVHFVNTTNYDPNQVVQGKINAVGCYQSNEPLTLKAEHAQFNEFTPAQFHVTGTFNVQFFNKTFLAAHYAAAKDWMRADLRAFDYCAAHQAACVNIEGDYAQPGRRRIRDQPRAAGVGPGERPRAASHAAREGVGVQSVAEFQPEADELTRFGLVKSVPRQRRWRTRRWWHRCTTARPLSGRNRPAWAAVASTRSGALDPGLMLRLSIPALPVRREGDARKTTSAGRQATPWKPSTGSFR